MGWKNVKEHYRIGHIVQVVADRGICIGSPYIHDIIVIGLDGVVVKPDDRFSGNEDLQRYQDEFSADPAKLKELVVSPDVFSADVEVFTYDGGKIVRKLCEKPGWPNVTHDGEMMYGNTFSTDREKVKEWAIRNAEAGISLAMDRVAKNKTALDEAEQWLAEMQANLAELTGTKGNQ